MCENGDDRFFATEGSKFVKGDQIRLCNWTSACLESILDPRSSGARSLGSWLPPPCLSQEQPQSRARRESTKLAWHIFPNSGGWKKLSKLSHCLDFSPVQPRPWAAWHQVQDHWGSQRCESQQKHLKRRVITLTAFMCFYATKGLLVTQICTKREPMKTVWGLGRVSRGLQPSSIRQLW